LILELGEHLGFDAGDIRDEGLREGIQLATNDSGGNVGWHTDHDDGRLVCVARASTGSVINCQLQICWR
jgi:hypothetical protein